MSAPVSTVLLHSRNINMLLPLYPVYGIIIPSKLSPQKEAIPQL